MVNLLNINPNLNQEDKIKKIIYKIQDLITSENQKQKTKCVINIISNITNKLEINNEINKNLNTN